MTDVNCFRCVVNGVVIAFSCGKYNGALYAHHAELMTLRDGLFLAISNDLQLACIERDAIYIMNDVNYCSFDSKFGVLFQDIIELLFVRSGTCCHFSRQSNMVAHIVAVLGIS